MQPASPIADQPRFEQIELGPTEHLSLHELEASDLPLGLDFRPGLGQRRGDSLSVSRQAVREGREEAASRRVDPGVEVVCSPLADHGLEAGQERPRLVERRYRSIRCQRSATWIVVGYARAAASP